MNFNFHMIHNATRTSLYICDDQWKMISAMISWKQPYMNLQEGEAWSLLTTLHFIAPINFNNVVFELDYMVVGKINIACKDSIDPSYRIWFVKR